MLHCLHPVGEPGEGEAGCAHGLAQPMYVLSFSSSSRLLHHIWPYTLFCVASFLKVHFQIGLNFMHGDKSCLSLLWTEIGTQKIKCFVIMCLLDILLVLSRPASCNIALFNALERYSKCFVAWSSPYLSSCWTLGHTKYENSKWCWPHFLIMKS